MCALVRRSRPELEALGVEVRAFDALDGVDTVVHVAGTFAMRGDWRETMVEANTRTTERLLATGRRIVLCSSSVTIGFGPRHAPGNEDTPLDPRVYGDGPLRAYCETKLAAESSVLSAGGVVVNPDFVVGPFDFGPTSGGLLLMLARKRLPFWPRGVKCFQPVDDCVAGHVGGDRSRRPGTALLPRRREPSVPRVPRDGRAGARRARPAMAASPRARRARSRARPDRAAPLTRRDPSRWRSSATATARGRARSSMCRRRPSATQSWTRCAGFAAGCGTTRFESPKNPNGAH